MVAKKPNRLRPRPLLIAAVAAVVTMGVPSFAVAAGGGGTVSGGGGPNPEEIRLKHERARVAAAPLKFGAESYESVRSAAADAAGTADCSVSTDAATYLTLSTTWPEVAGSGEAPSPMTLSRYDDQTALADPEQRGDGLFFNPGVGIWQLDSAGLGADETAATAIDSAAAASKVAPYLVGKYCDSVGSGASSAAARATAWKAWHACDEGACEDVYQRLAKEGVAKDSTVSRYGGAEPRKCTYEGASYDCLYVDPGAVEGEDAWTSPDFGPAPVPDPFYVFTYTSGGADYEVRYWLDADSGAESDVSASRELGVDARTALHWEADSGLCDTTATRGDC
ncbi:hypothetical protein OOZ19_18685 [Saccharopolyspora sp. NFXS83]|uniref:hypothetical protein n=1 Tax=Saccharopolyspora sp. NFXS83 TaxID=2993560 RepID=UPI00224B28F1|nr:hypothetical protein [Saccharopolyspora sp. NFXS83]MCX2732269.1 hypothetical protein [Saccharopolyspora sp. NFXS83]